MRAALALIVAACGGAQSPAPAPSVDVRDPGAEPREVIRFEPPLHLSERMEFDVKVHRAMAVTYTNLATGKQDNDFPTIRLTSTREVTAADATGVTIASEIVDVAVLEDAIDPKLRAQAIAMTRKLKGTRTTVHVDPSGRTSTVEVPVFEHSVLDVAVGLPDTPIGVGAKWAVTSIDRAGKVTWHRTTSCHLTALTETSATVDVVVTIKADNQAVRAEPNYTLRLTSGQVAASGRLVVPRHGIVTTGTLQGNSELNYQEVSGHERKAYSMRDETLAITRRSPD